MAPVASSSPTAPALSRPRPALTSRPTGSGARRGDARGAPEPTARSDGSALAVVAKIKSALRLVALDETAERARPAPRPAARRCPRHDPGAARSSTTTPPPMPTLLAAIADWAERYTPLVALDPPDGLMLDITGCGPSLRRRGSARSPILSPALDGSGLLRRRRDRRHARRRVRRRPFRRRRRSSPPGGAGGDARSPAARRPASRSARRSPRSSASA